MTVHCLLFYDPSLENLSVYRSEKVLIGLSPCCKKPLSGQDNLVLSTAVDNVNWPR